MNSLIQSLQGKKTYLTSLIVVALLIGQWMHLWKMPAEVYAALAALGLAFLRAGVNRQIGELSDLALSAPAPEVRAGLADAGKGGIVPAFALLLACCTMAQAQIDTNAPPPPATPTAFWNTALGWLSSHNPNNEETFFSKGEAWAGAVTMQGDVNLANEVGLSYKVYQPTNSNFSVSIEAITRDSGIAGTFVSQAVGPSLNIKVHDVELQIYTDAVYDLNSEAARFQDKIHAEIGARVKKAMTQNTFIGVETFVQVPGEVRGFGGFLGFTF
jgi:hypothetical protein